MRKELTERKKRILHALVDLYISTGQPVSSSDIQSKYLPEVSSATVRSELSALEALGYIGQPHTSSGRIPLKQAYKFYVETVSASDNDNMLTDQETARIRNRFMSKLGKIQNISKEAARIISDATNYTSFVVNKNLQDVFIDEVKLVPLKNGKALVLIVTNRGMITDKTIDIPENVNAKYVDTATKVLNKVFRGRNIKDMDRFDLTEIDVELKGFESILDDVLDILRVYLSEHKDKNVFVEGALKMLDYPEYNNVEDAKNFLSVISDKKNIGTLLADNDSSIEFSLRIGKEDRGVDKCAIVTASYKVGDEVVGEAGVIGPERMDYKKVIGVLDCMKKTIASVVKDKKNNED
ncbi:MAG TPA: heat-inducible transcription repressor HrcA [Clostridiales bacterium]|nr:heat-inducible transcription repressor HrcA [Clostridiales bacterium]HBW05974.1 heat-inducible transcription repressor HrcA [Clostridiales bacterium]HCH92859.1 heat-inducible transcription repressor HrcA [Clostridiales bacterium]